MFVDVAFPLNLSPLTYRLTEKGVVELKGRIVRAPVKGRDLYGLILNEVSSKELKDVKEIRSIHETFVSRSYISLIEWLSDYYLNPLGNVLRSLFFEETVKALLGYNPKNGRPLKVKDKWFVGRELTPISRSVVRGRYNTFLLHATSATQEEILLKSIFDEINPFIKGGIILVPEIDMIERIISMLDSMKDRICVFHSKLSKKKRAESLNYISSGQKDIVVGTRSAILAPLRNLSFIAVLEEHSQSYKAEEGIRYNGRDVAVMRGFIEKATVLLSSLCPSVESMYNVKVGKYHLLETKNMSVQRPKVRLINSRETKKKNHALSHEILKEAKRIKTLNGDFLFLTNKKGYSLLRCDDCGQSVKCRRCKIAMTFYKSDGLIKCHYCGLEEKVPNSCESCSGFKISLFGAGVEKIREELGKDFELRDMSLFVEAKYKRVMKHLRFDGVAILNVDLALAMPDFRSRERLFQDFIYISEKVKPDGTIFIQSSNLKDKMLGLMRNYDFKGFYESELLQRRELNYPPFSKIVLLNIFFKNNSETDIHEIEGLICGKKNRIVEILGAINVPSRNKLYKRCIQVLFKAKNRGQLHKAVSQFLDEMKNFKGIKIRVDVDPVRI
jgi:primosomal protein N' (replication factor Y)